MGLGDVSKRIVLGQKLRSSQLGETLLPKRIALPVFASDALSSVAYAPDEVFLMLGLAGSTVAFTWSWQIAIAVAVVMLAVIASYRQNVHAYPSGGGDYEVASVNLGQTAGVTVASALLVDYVLTVAVSISAGIDNAAAAIPFVNGHEAFYAVLLVALLATLNLRGVKESGSWFAIPTYGFMIAVFGMAAWGAVRIAIGDTPEVESADLQLIKAEGYEGTITTIGLLFLLARAFSSGCAALTGVEAISNGVPAFQKPKSRNAATTLLLLGVLSITMIMSIINLARETGLQYVDPRELDRLTAARRLAAAGVLRAAHRDLAAGPRHLRRLRPGLLLRGRDDRRDPGAGRQHRVQRLPGARLDPRQGRLPAAPARLARRPAGLQQRHPDPRGDGLRAHRGLRRPGDAADPALHRRRLRLLQPQPARHDPALDAAPEGPRPTRRSDAG